MYMDMIMIMGKTVTDKWYIVSAEGHGFNSKKLIIWFL